MRRSNSLGDEVDGSPWVIVMLGEVLSTSTALLWATSTILSARALKDIDPFSANALKTLFSVISMLPIAFVTGQMQGLSGLNPYGATLVVLSAIIGYGLGDTCLFRSISLIGVSRSYTIAYTYPLFTIVFATFFLGEPFLWRYVLGTLMIFSAILVLLAGGRSKNATVDSKGLSAAFATAILWSIGVLLINLGLKETSAILANTVRYPVLLLFLLLISRSWKKRSSLDRRNLIFLAASGALGMTIGGIMFLTSIQLIGVSRATPLSSSSPVWASLMSSVILKEKVTWKVVASSVMVVAGIYFLT